MTGNHKLWSRLNGELTTYSEIDTNSYPLVEALNLSKKVYAEAESVSQTSSSQNISERWLSNCGASSIQTNSRKGEFADDQKIKEWINFEAERTKWYEEEYNNYNRGILPKNIDSFRGSVTRPNLKYDEVNYSRNNVIDKESTLFNYSYKNIEGNLKKINSQTTNIVKNLNIESKYLNIESKDMNIESNVSNTLSKYEFNYLDNDMSRKFQSSFSDSVKEITENENSIKINSKYINLNPVLDCTNSNNGRVFFDAKNYLSDGESCFNYQDVNEEVETDNDGNKFVIKNKNLCAIFNAERLKKKRKNELLKAKDDLVLNTKDYLNVDERINDTRDDSRLAAAIESKFNITTVSGIPFQNCIVENNEDRVGIGDAILPIEYNSLEVDSKNVFVKDKYGLERVESLHDSNAVDKEVTKLSVEYKDLSAVSKTESNCKKYDKGSIQIEERFVDLVENSHVSDKETRNSEVFVKVEEICVDADEKLRDEVTYSNNISNIKTEKDLLETDENFVDINEKSLTNYDTNKDIKLEMEEVNLSFEYGEFGAVSEVKTEYDETLLESINNFNNIEVDTRFLETKDSFKDVKEEVINNFEGKETRPVKKEVKVGNSNSSVVCTVCNKTLSRGHYLHVHMRIHTGEKPYSCPTCGKLFVQDCALTRHSLVHSKIKPYACSMCEKAFTSSSNLYKHKQLHTNEKIYACDQCKKSFNLLAKLLRHKQIHSGCQQFRCELCGKAYSQKGHLIIHKRKHTGERPFSCQQCFKTFSNVSDLNRHKITHETQFLFACEVCHKSFTHVRGLKRHQTIHSPEKRYACDLCDTSYKYANLLKRHKRRHAMGKPMIYKART